jgi:hypothetical protein
MLSSDVLEARAVLTGARGQRARNASAMIGCDCLDWRVHGHVCAGLSPPSQGESNDWRNIPGLRNPAPRPEPAPGDWLSSLPRQRTAAHAAHSTAPVTESAAA